MDNLNKPNDTTQQLEEIRKARLAEAYKATKANNEPTVVNDPPVDDSTKKVEKPLDIDQKNSYINIDLNNIDDETRQTLEKTFNGDPLKAIKAWKDSNREFMRFQNAIKQDQEYLDKISAIVEKNPVIGEILDKADKNEDIESFLVKKFSESQRDKPNSNQKSKPNVTNTDISEKDLVEAGYLVADQKNFLNAEEWSEQVRQASIRYMYNELPNKLAKTAAERYQEQIDKLENERRLEQQRKQNEDLILKRYLDGVEKISTKYTLDFVNNDEHKALLPEIEKRAAGIPDLENPNVIDEDAVEIATEWILRKKGLLETLTQTRPETTDNIYARNQFNVNTRERATNKPTTLAEKLRQKHLENYEIGLQRQVVSKSEN